MFRLKTTALIAGSLLGIFVVHVTARGRSFPIEVTGTIKMFDRANHIFTFQSDKRARVLTIAVGGDCKFFQNGAPTGEWILKKGARVKVSYFSTIFTGNIAVKIESNPVRQNITNRDGPCQGSSGENELGPSAESPQSMLSTHAINQNFIMSTSPLEVSSLGKSLRSKRRSTRDSLVVAASLRSQISRLGKIGSEFGSIKWVELKLSL